MSRSRPAPFPGRHFDDVIIILCVRWYLRYLLNYRDLEEMMAERGVKVDHVTIWRWGPALCALLNQRFRYELRRPNASWRVDETYIRVAGTWTYLYRAVDSAGDTIDFMLSPQRDLTAARLLLRLALSRTGGTRAPRDQYGRTPGIRPRNRRIEAMRGLGPALPLPTLALLEHHY